MSIVHLAATDRDVHRTRFDTNSVKIATTFSDKTFKRKPTMKRALQDSPETQAILERMDEVRRDLDKGAQEIAESARDMGEWRHYVKSYPWISMGTACAIGYMIVPRRRVDVGQVNQTLADLHGQSGSSLWFSSAPKRGIRNAVKRFASNMIWRSVLSYGMRQANQYLASQLVNSQSVNSRQEEES